MAVELRRGVSSDLFSRDMVLLAWLPMVVIGALHYGTASEHHWAHDVLRRLYYLPILFAAFSRGLRGALAVAVAVSLTYVPHAFLVSHGAQDPGGTVNKLLEIVLYNVIGAVAGILADREGRRRRQAEAAYAEQQRMSEQLVRAGRLAALGELVAGIAHEIKNPLHTLKGTSEIVNEVVPEDCEQAAMWKVHRDEIERLGRIAERFLSFARPSEPDLRRRRFGEVFDRAGELVEIQARGTGVTVQVTALADEVAGLMVEADADQIAEVVLNVAQNGFQALDGTGRMELSGSVRNVGQVHQAVLRLENDGPAIPEEALERIFDPFYTSSEGGTGLGLAIAERIAAAHRGFLEVENLGRTGVAFHVVLPEAAEPP